MRFDGGKHEPAKGKVKFRAVEFVVAFESAVVECELSFEQPSDKDFVEVESA